MELAEKAAEFGWIPRQRTALAGQAEAAISLEEIREKLDRDTLTIGVIGQMKCGKSTFLNSFVFQDTVLPTATTPMTASLSVITYGPEPHIRAEFYTRDEWEEQKMQAARDENDAANRLDESKIKAAKELVARSAALGDELESLLGTTRDDSFEHLAEYVGVEGRFVSITKSVTIYSPQEYLKGVEIVDTPGFNDPIVSREERTKEFLKKADVVIMLLYAGRPFDATDRDIIFKHVRQCGVGKLLIGINKYDIPYCSEVNPEDEQQIKDYVKAEIRRACSECNDSTLVEILDETEPIPLSAEMALLSQLPMSKIAADESLNFAFKRHAANFGISTQPEFLQWSHQQDLVAAVQTVVQKEKDAMLFAKPLNAILAAGHQLQADIESELGQVDSRMELLQMPDLELDEKEEALGKVHRRMTKKIDMLGEDLDVEIQALVRKGKHDLEDIMDGTCKRMRDIVRNDWSAVKSFESILPRLEAEMQTFITRRLKRATENLAYEGERKINRNIEDFFADAEELLMRYLPEFDSRDFIRATKNKIQLDIESNRLFSYSPDAFSPKNEKGLVDVLWRFMNSFSGGLYGVYGNVLTHQDTQNRIEGAINTLAAEFNPQPYLDQAFQRKDEVMGFVRSSFMADLIEPLQSQLQQLRTKRDDRQSELQAAQTRKAELEQRQQSLAQQLVSITNLRSQL